MNHIIQYLNTDLDLRSHRNLTEVAKEFARQGVYALRCQQDQDGAWCATFEAEGEDCQPEAHIATMLAAIEALPPSLRAIWDACMLREFNLGYDCGNEPWAFNQGLTANTLGRMATLGTALRITLYPAQRQPASLP